MKAILVLDIDNIFVEDAQEIYIESTRATYIELQCNNHTTQMSLINHWLKPLPKRIGSASEYGSDDEYIKRLIIWKKEIDEILGETE